MSSELIYAVFAERARSVKVWAADFKAVQFPVGVRNVILLNQGWAETWAPVQSDILTLVVGSLGFSSLSCFQTSVVFSAYARPQRTLP